MIKLKERKPAETAITPASVPPKRRRLKQLSSAIARHPQLTKTFIFLAFTGGTGFFLLYSLFKGAWTPERDNLIILNTILKMELNRESTRAINDNPQQLVTRSYESLEPHVEADDWRWVNRFGGTITYGKQDQRLIASCSPYSPALPGL